MPTHSESHARATITELVHAYCRAVDRIDAELGKSIWHDGAMADYGAVYQGPGPGVIDLICAQHRRALATSHRVTNLIVSVSGETAGSETYVHASIRMPGDTPDAPRREITVHGRYLDRWALRGGRWGLDHRRFVRDFDEIRSVTPLSGESDARRDRSDPSYAVLG